MPARCLTNRRRVPSQCAPVQKTNLASAIRAYIFTGLTNYAWYTITLPAGDGG